ncbi:TIGR01459 family HAD-type hydrolase [Roseibium aggregatum]|uniref:TIGR01459 family HAD-type hydrolase n=1 Tax=Roseibium aggregatum TaxID=187304 RepID=A0A939J0B1_9HYPH|nr:TIGR01459 family HAD-type hydrolase [Roseibium aggregatum]MBN9669088.1 TIGR01459 family HAD-type hydrolase [Roseibium aggregatum]
MTVSAPLLIDGLRVLAPSYQGILCDVWGVLHNGVAAFEEAHHALRTFREETGGKVVLITNAPRPAPQVAEMLTSLGVPGEAYDGIVTSGDVTRESLVAQGSKKLLHIGPNRDQPLYWNLEATFTSDDDESAEAISCTGLVDDETETPDDYRDRLQKLADRKVPMICANPDIVVERGDRLIWCAGALARLYEDLGGEVTILGKPHAPIYRAALKMLETLSGNAVAKEDVLAIGDGLPTDIRGAVSQDIDVLFITAGIHASDFGPSDAPEEPLIRRRLVEEGLRARAALPRLWW